MFRGISFALGACFIWGLIFVVPQFMAGFSPIEVALGRYLFYGTLSTLIFFKISSGGRCRHPTSIWLKALFFSFISTIGYYTCVVLGLRYSTPAASTLLLGISPITIAFLGNWKQREIPYKVLIFPSFLLLVGLVIINIPHMNGHLCPSCHLLGLGFSLLALIAWSWFVVDNAQFLKNHPHVLSSEWTTMIGVATLFWVILLGSIVLAFFKGQLQTDKYFILNGELTTFLVGSAILGLICSWVGAFLWNQASLHLPVTVAGQLTIFETLFGTMFVYAVSQNLPSITESVGIVILLFAVFLGIRKFSSNKTYDDEIAPH